MATSIKLLAVGLLVLMGLVILDIGLTVRKAAQNVEQQASTLVPARSSGGTWRTGPAIDYPTPLEPAPNLRIEQMRAELDRARAEAQRQSQLVKKTQEEQARLENELDDAVAIIDELLTLVRASAPGTSSDGPATSQPPLAVDPAAEVKQQLAKAQEEIDNLHRQAVLDEQHLADSAAELEAIQVAARQALVAAGPAAVPVLAMHLSHRRESIRIWAADVLGRIGRDAREAIPELSEALSDPSPQVREAVRRALQQIEGN
jgi:hypothetical protein